MIYNLQMYRPCKVCKALLGCELSFLTRQVCKAKALNGLENEQRIPSSQALSVCMSANSGICLLDYIAHSSGLYLFASSSNQSSVSAANWADASTRCTWTIFTVAHLQDAILYTVSQEKTRRSIFGHSVGERRRPVLKRLSLLSRQRNWLHLPLINVSSPVRLRCYTTLWSLKIQHNVSFYSYRQSYSVFVKLTLNFRTV